MTNAIKALKTKIEFQRRRLGHVESSEGIKFGKFEGDNHVSPAAMEDGRKTFDEYVKGIKSKVLSLLEKTGKKVTKNNLTETVGEVVNADRKKVDGEKVDGLSA